MPRVPCCEGKLSLLCVFPDILRPVESRLSPMHAGSASRTLIHYGMGSAGSIDLSHVSLPWYTSSPACVPALPRVLAAATHTRGVLALSAVRHCGQPCAVSR